MKGEKKPKKERKLKQKQKQIVKQNVKVNVQSSGGSGGGGSAMPSSFSDKTGENVRLQSILEQISRKISMPVSVPMPIQSRIEYEQPIYNPANDAETLKNVYNGSSDLNRPIVLGPTGHTPEIVIGNAFVPIKTKEPVDITGMSRDDTQTLMSQLSNPEQEFLIIPKKKSGNKPVNPFEKK